MPREEREAALMPNIKEKSWEVGVGLGAGYIYYMWSLGLPKLFMGTVRNQVRGTISTSDRWMALEYTLYSCSTEFVKQVCFMFSRDTCLNTSCTVGAKLLIPRRPSLEGSTSGILRVLKLFSGMRRYISSTHSKPITVKCEVQIDHRAPHCTRVRTAKLN